ncbi:peroxiredoxin [Pseudonocardia sp. CNS-139]|nr:peroxiredoxin [Pseudonocardia sp. CNS-139]
MTNPTAAASLAAQVKEMEAGVAAQAPAAALQTFAAEQARLDAGGVPAGVAAAGTALPEADLLDVHGAPTTMSAARGGRPAVVVFYRGAWCPYCNLALRVYEEQLRPELDARGVGLVAVSPQRPDGSLTMQETNNLTYTVVSDPGNSIAKALGVLSTVSDEMTATQQGLGLDVAAGNADGTGEIPMPTTLVVDAAGTIRWIDVHPNYATRSEPADILAAVASTLG